MAQSSGRSGIATALGLRGDVIRDAPPAPNVNPAEEALKAILGNLRNLPDAAKLGAGAQEALDKQLLASLERLMPGWSNLSQQITGNIASQARGELPQDVQNMIQRNAAEMGVTTGTSGSDFDKYRSLRNLGLTSLQVTDQALNSAARWMQATTAGAPKFDFTRAFISPETQIQTQMWNEENRWNVAWLEKQLKAQPSNSEQAWAQVLDYVADFATSMIGVGTAGIGKGGSGMGGGGGTGGGMDGGYGWTSYGG